MVTNPKKPRTKFGFPIGDASDTSSPRQQSQRGIAMMIAIMIISIMMMFAADFIVSSSVNITRASAQRDNIRAEYIAKSGANWAIWLILFDYGLQLQLGADPATKTMKDAIGNLWDKLNMVFPYESGLDLTEVDKFAKLFGLSALSDSVLIDLLKSLGGELGVEVEDEAGKINLNVCYTSSSECDVVLMEIEALMNCTQVEEDYNKQNNIKPSELSRRIKDWIFKHASTEPGSGFSDKNDPYQKRKPPYKVKGTPMDSVNELLLVEGWTPELHQYYSPYFTVWPFPDVTSKNGFKLNINSMPQEALRCMFSKELGTPEANEKFVKKYKDLIDKAGKIAGSDTELQTVISDMMSYRSGSGADKTATGDKSSWLTTDSRTFSVKAKGVVGSQTRIVQYVIQRATAQQMTTSTNGQPWTMPFFRMY